MNTTTSQTSTPSQPSPIAYLVTGQVAIHEENFQGADTSNLIPWRGFIMPLKPEHIEQFGDVAAGAAAELGAETLDASRPKDGDGVQYIGPNLDLRGAEGTFSFNTDREDADDYPYKVKRTDVEPPVVLYVKTDDLPHWKVTEPAEVVEPADDTDCDRD